VSDVVGGSMHLLDTFVAEAGAAIVEDSSEVIILGCAGLSELVEPMSKVLGVPVIDGVTAAVVILEGLLAQGLRTSRANTFAAPPRVAASGPDLS
jgi:allantoin racemase